MHNRSHSGQKECQISGKRASFTHATEIGGISAFIQPLLIGFVIQYKYGSNKIKKE